MLQVLFHTFSYGEYTVTKYARFSVLTAVFLKIQVLCNVTLCRIVNSSDVWNDRSTFEHSGNVYVKTQETCILRKK